MLLNPFKFHSPTTLAEAISLYTSLEGVKLQAGGTFLLNSLKLLKRKGVKTPDHIVSLRKVNELIGAEMKGGRLIIKSMTTINDLADSPLLQDNLSVFTIVTKNISTNPIRNMATVGGNLTCRYTWTEMPAVMIALDATMHFEGANGEKDELPAEEFFIAAAKTDKIFTHVSIKKDANMTTAYRRVKKSPNVDIPLLSLLVTTTFEGNKFTNTRVGVNNCVAFAQRDRKLEDFLNQSECSDKIAQEALDHLNDTLYDTRSSEYKSHVFRMSITSAIEELVNKNGS